MQQRNDVNTDREQGTEQRYTIDTCIIVLYTIPFYIDGCFTTAEDDCGNDVLDVGETCDCGLNFDRATMLCNEDPCCNGSSCRVANDAECRLDCIYLTDKVVPFYFF